MVKHSGLFYDRLKLNPCPSCCRGLISVSGSFTVDQLGINQLTSHGAIGNFNMAVECP